MPRKKATQHTPYSDELADHIIALVEDGHWMSDIEKMEGMPRYQTWWLWRKARPDLEARYQAAVEIAAERLVAESVAIADDASGDYEGEGKDRKRNRDNIRRSELRIRTRIQIAEKMAPHRFGQRQQIDVNDMSKASTADLIEQMKTFGGQLGVEIPPHLLTLVKIEG